jgi:hypothetical protein
VVKRAGLGVVLVAAVIAAASALALAAADDDRSAAESAIARLEKDPHEKTLCADPIRHARDALERAHRMRFAGDDEHARLAEGLALEWTRVAQELARADAAETRAAAARAATSDAGARVERERALLEQQLAENGRLRAELAKAEAQDGGVAKPPRRRDGGARR